MYVCRSHKTTKRLQIEAEETHYRVCYLARARAMARVVLAQIEFAGAICGSRKILPMLLIVTVTFLHSDRKMHDNFTAGQWTVYCWSLYRSHRSLYRPLYSAKTIDIVCRNLLICSYFLCSHHSDIE